MAEPILDTATLKDCIDRWRDGDRAAADDLLRLVIGRLENLARRMIRGVPIVRSEADTDDLLQNSVMRLLRSLRKLRPEAPRDFFNLAALHIRRELLDLIRSCQRRSRLTIDAGWPHPMLERESIPASICEADRWLLFHQSVDRLPIQEREVVGLMYYHGWTQQRIAEFLQVHDRTIRRRWTSARNILREMIGKDMTDFY
jgi:RNA polymerase sigma factor (sigma-70 family)